MDAVLSGRPSRLARECGYVAQKHVHLLIRADAHAQIVVNARKVEIPHQHAPFAELSVQIGRPYAGMRDEKEICL